MVNYIDAIHIKTDDYTPKIHEDVCICMIDIVNFSIWCGNKTPAEIFKAMTEYNLFLSKIMEKYRYLTKIELVGDSVLIVSSLDAKVPSFSRTDAVVEMSKDILNNIDMIKQIFEENVSLRIGIHVGDIYSGFIQNPTKFQIFGNSINIASRLESSSLPGTYSLSEKSYMLLNNKSSNTQIGKKKCSLMKGVGLIEFRSGFMHRKKVLIADDDENCIIVFKKMVQIKYNLESIAVSTITETFQTMKQNTYEFCVLDIHFIDSCVLEFLREFRDWESVYRNHRQKILLTSSDIDDNVLKTYSNLIEGCIDKTKIYDIEYYPDL